jgi:general stress protein 26
MKIPMEVQRALQNAREYHFVTLTTLGQEGWPHTRPMSLVRVADDGESLLFAAVNPGDTADNLSRNRRAEVLIARRDPVKEGYNLEGWAEYLDDPRDAAVQVARGMSRWDPVMGAFRFHVERIRVATPLDTRTGALLPGSARPGRSFFPEQEAAVKAVNSKAEE